jgi:hypothetical protein
MKFSIHDYAQRELHYAIVDEVDSILIDEARTPLIISGEGREARATSTSQVDRSCPKLRGRALRGRREGPPCLADRRGHRARAVEAARRKIIAARTSTIPRTSRRCTSSSSRLRAHTLYKRDSTTSSRQGRQGHHRRRVHGPQARGAALVDGLHQAVEAKERVPIQSESRTLATITFQNYFRLYRKLAGMTGTADTEAAGVPQDLQPRRRRHPDQPRHQAHRPRRPRLQDRAREVQGGRRGDQGVHEARAARAGGHDERREVRGDGEDARQEGRSRTRCSTPSSTSARPTSSRRRAARARSRSRPTWPAAAPTSSSAATPR